MHNTGSIFRTADGAGVEKIYLCGHTPAPYDELGKPRIRFTKVSLGAENYVEWERGSSTSSPRGAKTHILLDNLKKEGFRIYALETSKNSVPYFKVKPTREELKKIALVVGHEVKGLTPGILKRADKVLEIPMKGEKKSLNVSVAFGVAVFNLSHPK